MANDQCCVPLCNNDKRYDSGKDLSYFKQLACHSPAISLQTELSLRCFRNKGKGRRDRAVLKAI